MAVCPLCQRYYEIKKTGVWVIQTRGKTQIWYKVYRGDIYKCAGCKTEIVDYISLPMFEEGKQIDHNVRTLVTSQEHYYAREFPLDEAKTSST